MHFSLLSAASLVLAAVNAVSIPSTSSHQVESYSTFRTLDFIPEGWSVDKSPVNPQSKLKARIQLKQQNLALFEQRVLDVSTPGHELYGQHMDQATISNMLKPSAQDEEKVVSWLLRHGLQKQMTVSSDWIYLDTTVGQMEDLIKAKYQYFTHAETKDRVLRTTKYSLPAELQRSISLVAPTTMLGRVSAMRSTIHRKEKTPAGTHAAFVAGDVVAESAGAVSKLTQSNAVPSACAYSITPDCLKSLYNLGNFTAKAGTNTLGIAGYLEQYVQNDDLTAFLKRYAASVATGISAANTTPGYTFQAVKGGLNTQGTSLDFGEANLDAQYGISISWPTKAIYYQTAGRPPTTPDPGAPGGESTNEPYLDWLDYILAQPTIPATITTSYGEDEQSVPLDYATSVCNKFAQLGARGISVLFSSGDSGPGSSCYDFQLNKTQFQASFPAACPYVTAVGGTVGINPERAVSFSSGGFSKYWAIPSYQKTAQAAWQKQQGSTFAGLYNQSGRGFPDVAAQGDNFHITYSGSDELIGGTSASAPTFSAFVALLNGNLVAQGKQPLGFLNPWLYGAGKAGLTDIKAGTSTGCTSGKGEVDNAGW
jgi:tripeptidyl-peptidase I